MSTQLRQLTLENRITQSFKYKKKSAQNVVSAVRQFLYFTGYFWLKPIPADQKTITLFLEFMARSAGYGHIKHLLSSVRYVHEALDYPVDVFTSFQVTITMAGLKRRLANVPFQVLPITPDILRNMYKFINTDLKSDVALWCSFLVAFYGLLRKASTVPETKAYDDSTALRRRHIKVDHVNKMVYIYLGYSKSNNFCTRDIVIPVPANSDPALDLYRHISSLFSEVSVGEDSPAFSYSAKSFISYNSFTTRLKRLLSQAGYNPDLYSGHSFRRGGATFLHNCGGTAIMVQASGDWVSQCFTKYLYLSEAQRFSAQLLMRSGIELPHE